MRDEPFATMPSVLINKCTLLGLGRLRFFLRTEMRRVPRRPTEAQNVEEEVLCEARCEQKVRGGVKCEN